MRLAAFILFTAAVSAFGQTYSASIFAGVGLPENLPANSVSLGEIDAITADSACNVFMALGSYDAVVRVDATTGILTRIAGDGTAGFSGDNGPAVNAQLYGPAALTVDLAGNLYIADSGNNRIRKVANGVITTVAGNGVNGSSGDGGPATSAELDYPSGVATDSAGNLYIEDGSGVRKVANGTIASVAGAQGNFWSLAVDAPGNVYVMDSTAYRIVKVANGVVTTVAGNGMQGFSPDGTPAINASLGGPLDCAPPNIAVDSVGNLYIADSGDNLVREVLNGIMTTVAGGGSSPGGTSAASVRLNYPQFIAVNAAGSLYITDNPAGLTGLRVLEIANGMVADVAGNSEYSFSGDNGPAANAQLYQPSGVSVDSAGRVYIADTRNNRIRMVANGVVTTVAGTGTWGSGGDNGPAVSAQLAAPAGVAADAAGDLYIADVDTIRKVAGGIITTVAGTAGYTPCTIAAGSAGDVYLYDCESHRVLKVSNGTATTVAGDGSFGVSGDNGPATSAGVGGVAGMAVDSSGNLYLADSGQIRKVSNGMITTIAPGACVASDPSGDLFIVDPNLGLIRRPSTTGIDAFPYHPPLVFRGTGIAVDSSGNIYGSDGARIVMLKPDSSLSPPTSVSLDFIDNAASNVFAGLAPGEIVTLTGSGLGPPKLVSSSPGADGFYPTQLAGTSVQIGGVAAPLLYTSATQVAAVVPFEVTGASAQVTVTYQAQTSAPATVAAYATAPGLFTVTGSEYGQAAAVNRDGSINSAFNPAPVGSVISLYATGGGQTLSGGVDGNVATAPLPGLTSPVSVTIGGSLLSPSQVQYVGAAPGEIAGVLQINGQIPAGIQPGFGVVVTINVGARQSQPVVIAVSAARN